MCALKTPQRFKKDNFNLNNYIERVAILDIKYGYYDRDDYLARQPAYIAKRKELLENLDRKENK